jgi:hypothetical protein
MTITITRAVSILLVCTLFQLAASAADAPQGGAPSAPADADAAAAQASIPFANHGGINDWRVVDDHTVLIQGTGRQWYKASLMTPCINLPFAQRIGFKSNPDGSFDKFSAIKLRHQTCPLTSLVKTDPPAKRSKPHKAAPPAAEVRPDNAGTAPTAPAP